MKVNLKNISESFDISQREILGENVYLINPKEMKHQWLPEEHILRSCILNEAGEIISLGFPKFFNLGENKEEDQKFFELMKENEVCSAEKLDGSLIIRSVYKNKIILRTRGSHNLGLFEDRVMSLIAEKYPILLDEKFEPNNNFLFEYVSPDNRIILKYSESRLVYLAKISMDGELTVGRKHSQYFQANYGFDIPRFYGSNSSSIDDICSIVEGLSGEEGVVVWCKDHLKKIKCKEYLRLHSLRFSLSRARLAKVAYASELRSEADCEKFLYDLGYDYEAVQMVLPVMLSIMNEFFDRRQDILSNFESLKSENIPPSRKQAAIFLREKYPKYFDIFIYYVTGDMARFNRMIEARVLDCSPPLLEEFKREAVEIIERLRK
jgi:hypothetical protein